MKMTDSKKHARSESLLPRTIVGEDGIAFTWNGANYVDKNGRIYEEDLQKRASYMPGALTDQIAAIQALSKKQIRKMAKAQRKVEKSAAHSILLHQAAAGDPIASRLVRELVLSVTKVSGTTRSRDEAILAAGTHTETEPTRFDGSEQGPWFKHDRPVSPRDAATKAVRADTINREGTLGR